MDIRRKLVLAFALALGAPLGIAEAQTTPVQVDPGSNLAELYPRAGNIGLALAIAPDPHIPRYRRIFDLQIQAITLGMLNDGYVLDRYAFPWTHTISGEKDPKAPPPGLDKDAFGLMIFRCDGWRGHICQDRSTLAPGAVPESGKTTRVRAVYLVTETATWAFRSRRW